MPENAGKKVTELAQKSGIPVLWMNSNSSSVWEGSLAYSLRRKGIPNVVIESGIIAGWCFSDDERVRHF